MNGPWLFSRTVDLWTFGGSALLSLLLLALGWRQGWLTSETPEWTWVTGVLLVDVAHVYATMFRVYLLPGEFARRIGLYGLTPLLGFGVAWALASENESLFWRVLAYLAVFHFIRQQAGWVAWYRAKAQEPDGWPRWLDQATILLATVYPLVEWHARLPRDYWWFLPGDFVPLPPWVATILFPVYLATLGTYAARSVWLRVWRQTANPGKDLVVVTTALCWYVGIVAFNSDYAFTVTNLFIHGIPYMVLTFWYARRSGDLRWFPRRRLPAIVFFLATIWFFAYAEELLWDRSHWQERSWLFGPEFSPGAWHSFFLALLVTPQLTHYILDGFLWRRGGNPQLKEILSRPSPVP